MDNERWPRLAPKCDWSSSSDFLRPYAELWSGQIDNWMDLGSLVSPERFASGGFLYWRINLGSIPEVQETYMDPRKASLVRLEVSRQPHLASALLDLCICVDTKKRVDE